MGVIPEYSRGFQDGVRKAITWLHYRAGTMRDPKATAIIDSAATNLGWEHFPEKQARKDHSELATLRDRLAEAERELSACTESPGGCGYWRERAARAERQRDEAESHLERTADALRRQGVHQTYPDKCNCIACRARAYLDRARAAQEPER